MAEKIILETRGITKSFGKKEKEIQAVKPTDLVLHRGECFGLVGESGCGKSTLGRMLASLLPSTKGGLFLQGEPVDALRRREKRHFYRHVQMVFQDPYSVFSPRMRVESFVAQGMLHFGLVEKREIHGEVVRLLCQVGLDEGFCERLPDELSGGELQRIVIARAISVQPDLVILDEATSALDVLVQQQILELLLELKASLHMTYFFISHNLAVVHKMADRIGVMRDGVILDTFESSRLLSGEVHPYVRELLQSRQQNTRARPCAQKNGF